MTPLDNLSRFHYTRELEELVGTRIPKWPKVGPIMKLEENGSCLYEPKSDHNSDDFLVRWKKIARGEPTAIHSRPILLPNAFNGLLVQVTLCCSETNPRFHIKLFVEDLEHNRKVILPVALSLRVSIESGDVNYKSPWRRFTVKRLHS